MKKTLVVLAGAAAIAALAIFFLHGEPTRHGAAHVLAAPKPPSVSESAPPQSAKTPSRKTRTRIPAPQARKPASPATDSDRVQFAQDVDALVALLGEKPPKDKKARREFREKTSKARRAVAEAMRAHPELSLALLKRVGSVDESRTAMSLAALLRMPRDPDLVAALEEQARQGARPRDRSAALAALETRDTAVWLPLTTRAYSSDPAPEVRTEAAGILARSLADWGRPQSHAEVRKLLYGSLASKDPAERIRALRALLNDRNAPPDDLARIEDLSKSDPDETVRTEAARTLRAIRTLRGG